jgi:hypothetical protein
MLPKNKSGLGVRAAEAGSCVGAIRPFTAD